MYIFLLGLLPSLLITKKVDCSTVEVERSQTQECLITYQEILTNFRAALGLAANFLCLFFCAYFEPTLALQLQSHNIGDETIGLVFASTGFAFGLGAVFSGMLAQLFKKQYIYLLTYFCLIFSCLLTGPSQYLGFPNHVGLMTIGVAFSWFFSAFPQAITLPEIIEAVTEKKKGYWMH